MSDNERILGYKSAEPQETKYRRPFDKATGEYWDEIDDRWREKLWGPKRL